VYYAPVMNNNKTFIKIASVIAFVLMAFTASAKDSLKTIRIGVLNGPSGLPMAYEMENTKTISGVAVEYSTYAQANLLLPKLIKGEVDMGFLPPNVAAKVYNANNGALVVCAVTGNGMLSLVTKDTSIKSFEDLKGKKIAVAGQGATPEYMFRYLLSSYGIECGTEEGQVELDFSIPNPEIAAALITGKVEYALVPEPFATVSQMKDKEVFVALDIQKEYEKVSGNASYPMSVLVCNAKFAKENESLVRKVCKEVKKAGEWAVKNPSETGVLVEKHGLGLTAPIASRAIPKANYVYMTAKEGRTYLEKLLTLFLEFNPQSIGGKLPDDGFYFK